MRILWVENHAAFARVAGKQFLSGHDVTVVPSLSAARSSLLEKEYDAVLLDYDLDDGKGVDLVEPLLKRRPRPLVVAVSSHDRGNDALVAAGADAACPKMRFGEIGPILARWSPPRAGVAPALEGVLETSLYVEDLGRSSAFYRTVFGFEEVFANERVHAVEVAPRQILLLFLKGESAKLPVAAHDGSGRSHLAFAIAAPELSAWEDWLARKGVAVEEKRHWDRGGWSLYFRDPDGHLLEVATPGVWPRVY